MCTAGSRRTNGGADTFLSFFDKFGTNGASGRLGGLRSQKRADPNAGYCSYSHPLYRATSGAGGFLTAYGGNPAAGQRNNGRLDFFQNYDDAALFCADAADNMLPCTVDGAGVNTQCTTAAACNADRTAGCCDYSAELRGRFHANEVHDRCVVDEVNLSGARGQFCCAGTSPNVATARYGYFAPGLGGRAANQATSAWYPPVFELLGVNAAGTGFAVTDRFSDPNRWSVAVDDAADLNVAGADAGRRALGGYWFDTAADFASFSFNWAAPMVCSDTGLACLDTCDCRSAVDGACPTQFGAIARTYTCNTVTGFCNDNSGATACATDADCAGVQAAATCVAAPGPVDTNQLPGAGADECPQCHRCDFDGTFGNGVAAAVTGLRGDHLTFCTPATAATDCRAMACDNTFATCTTDADCGGGTCQALGCFPIAGLVPSAPRLAQWKMTTNEFVGSEEIKRDDDVYEQPCFCGLNTAANEMWSEPYWVSNTANIVNPFGGSYKAQIGGQCGDDNDCADGALCHATSLAGNVCVPTSYRAPLGYRHLGDGGQYSIFTDRGGCFSGDSMVRVRGISAPITMAKIQVNDYVEVAQEDGTTAYERVYAFLDRDPEGKATFVHISTPQGVLKVTSTHVVFVAQDATAPLSKMSPVFAKDVATGQFVYVRDASGKMVPVQVTGVQQVEATGLYAPLTQSGTLVVDNVHVSAYAQFKHPSVAHAAMKPLSWYHSVAGIFNSGKQEPTNGVHPYAAMLQRIKLLSEKY
jgi:hypothetical protein